MVNAMKGKELVFILLPLLLWPLSFIILRGIFIYALACSTALLALISLALYRKAIPWKKIKGNYHVIVAGLAGAALLYLIFYSGNIATYLFGISGLVGNVYQMIYSNVPRLQLVILLAIIGVFEEIYWRGALQAYFKKNSKTFRSFPWLATTLYYTFVHVASLNPVLVLAAFIVGLVTSLVAERYGIISSIITHIVWIELIVVFLPVVVR